MNFNEKLRVLRAEAGMTQKETAKAIGVTDRTYQNYEAGSSTPSGAVLSRLAELFGVRMEWLTDVSQSFTPAAMDDELTALLAQMQALFSGGKVAEEDKKYVLNALTEAYFIAKKGKKEGGEDEK